MAKLTDRQFNDSLFIYYVSVVGFIKELHSTTYIEQSVSGYVVNTIVLRNIFLDTNDIISSANGNPIRWFLAYKERSPSEEHFLI